MLSVAFAQPLPPDKQKIAKDYMRCVYKYQGIGAGWSSRQYLGFKDNQKLTNAQKMLCYEMCQQVYANVQKPIQYESLVPGLMDVVQYSFMSSCVNECLNEPKKFNSQQEAIRWVDVQTKKVCYPILK